MTETLRIISKGIDKGKTILAETTRQKLIKFLQLEEGAWTFTRAKDKPYKSTRYKYLFGHVYLAAVTQFNRRGMYQIHIEETGETLPLTVEDLHDMMKQWFNPVVVKYQGMKIIKGGSTRKLSDSEFINEFLEKILHFLSEKDVICLSYSEWREKAESKEFSSLEIAQEAIDNQTTEFKDYS